MAGTSVQVYNSWWQVRSDAWSRLDEASRQLEGAAAAGQPLGGLLEIISDLLDSVARSNGTGRSPAPRPAAAPGSCSRRATTSGSRPWWRGSAGL